ncbi:hypothetical protein TNCV_4984011 [Trichonephila clavipes]|nr:hypothetical protein TNCV_4984011 [Trichonephila clavipes]
MNKMRETPVCRRDLRGVLERVSVLLDCPTALSEEFVTEDDNAYTAPIMAAKDILEFVQNSKNITDADSDNNEMIYAALSDSRVIRNEGLGSIMKSKKNCTYRELKKVAKDHHVILSLGRVQLKMPMQLTPKITPQHYLQASKQIIPVRETDILI